MTTATEPISPELVLVSPELRAALHAAWRSGPLEPRIGDERMSAGLPAVERAGAGAAEGASSWPSLALAATIYALSRTLWMLLEVALVLVVVSLAILVATGFLPL